MGPATATTLASYGIHSIGDLRRVPLLTLQRILGAATALTLSTRARGHDPRPVHAAAPPASMGCAHDSPRDELDPGAHRRVLLDLTEGLGLRLRAARRVTARLALSLTHAGGTSTRRSRALDEPTAHTPARAACAPTTCMPGSGSSGPASSSSPYASSPYAPSILRTTSTPYDNSSWIPATTSDAASRTPRTGHGPASARTPSAPQRRHNRPRREGSEQAARELVVMLRG
ncbi:hypothetical protein [Streptosporangium sp. NPDC002524]|uniref:DinB/UmuC family translesion DNA polymerase n=1 Tax=Streptosporangium sp. NPDC002524 TaxID=3154537 RepID=UPI00332E8326